MFNRLKLYVYGIVGLLMAGLYTVLKYKLMQLKDAQDKVKKAEANFKAQAFESRLKADKQEAQKPTNLDIKVGKYSLVLMFLLVGCESRMLQCPRLEKVSHVRPINFEVDSKLCVCGKDLDNLVNGTAQLRKSEGFYENEVDSYNKEFVDE